MELYSPTDTMIYSTYASTTNSTASLTYKIPNDIAGGEYLIKVYNY